MVETSDEILRLRRSGYSLRETGERVGLSWQRVQQVGADIVIPTITVTSSGYGQVTVVADMVGDELASRVGKALERLGDDVEYA